MKMRRDVMQMEDETQKARRPRSFCLQGISGTSLTSTMIRGILPRQTRMVSSFVLFLDEYAFVPPSYRRRGARSLSVL